MYVRIICVYMYTHIFTLYVYVCVCASVWLCWCEKTCCLEKCERTYHHDHRPSKKRTELEGHYMEHVH